MKSFVRAFATIAFSTATLTTASVAQAQLPSAADVVQKYITAIGGRDAILKVKSISQEGAMEIPALGLSATMVAHQAAPNSTASRMSIPGIGEIVRGFNGTVGWEINPMAGPRALTEKEVEQEKELNDFYSSRLFPAEKFSKMEVLEQLDFNGEQAYKVKMTRKTGLEQTMYFSTASGLLVGTEQTQESPNGQISTVMKFSGYEAVEGIKLPSRTEMSMGPTTIITTLKSTKFNAVPADAFAIPEAVKGLVGK